MENLYAIFVLYTEDEGNVVSEFVALSDSINNAQNIIKNSLIKFYPHDNQVYHKMMTSDNNFTYIGKRSDLFNFISSGINDYRTYNGFIIEPIKINEITLSNNI